VLVESLWEYGEDELAAQAAELSDIGLESVERLAVWHRLNDPPIASDAEPLDARILARAGIDYFECAVREPNRGRRRTRPATERIDPQR